MCLDKRMCLDNLLVIFLCLRSYFFFSEIKIFVLYVKIGRQHLYQERSGL